MAGGKEGERSLRQLGLVDRDTVLLEFVAAQAPVAAAAKGQNASAMDSTAAPAPAAAPAAAADDAATVRGDSAGEALVALAHSLLVRRWGMVCLVETPSSVPGFAPSVRGEWGDVRPPTCSR